MSKGTIETLTGVSLGQWMAALTVLFWIGRPVVKLANRLYWSWYRVTRRR